MPYKDPEKKKEKMAEWRRQKIADGYGKALYARRKHRLENEKILRAALLELAGMISNKESSHKMLAVITKAFDDAPPVTGAPIDYMPTKEE